MDDPLLVRGFEGVRDLRRDSERLVDGNRPADDPIGERRALDQLHHQGVYAVGVFEPVDLRDVRMIERREHPRFSPEAGEAIGIAGDGGQQDFDRDLAIERRVAGLVDLAHPARADTRRELIRADALPLEAPCHPGVVAPHHGWRLEKALFMRSSDDKSDSTSWRSASLPSQAAARYAGRSSVGSARAPANTSFRRGQSSGGRVTCCGFYSPARAPGGLRERRESRENAPAAVVPRATLRLAEGVNPRVVWEMLATRRYR